MLLLLAGWLAGMPMVFTDPLFFLCLPTALFAAVCLLKPSVHPRMWFSPVRSSVRLLLPPLLLAIENVGLQ